MGAGAGGKERIGRGDVVKMMVTIIRIAMRLRRLLARASTATSRGVMTRTRIYMGVWTAATMRMWTWVKQRLVRE